jgi:NADH dehydrogenase
VTVRVGALVTDVREDGVSIRTAEATEQVASRTILWAAGMAASPLGRLVAQAAGARIDRAGRVLVEPDLTVTGHPEVFVIGDLAAVDGPDGKPLIGVAQVAIQQGRYAAALIGARLAGRTLPPFRYHDLGNMATIGRAAAVADLGWMRLYGYPAWLVWLFIHLLWLVQFESRILVLVQWTWNYLTRNRSARLITGGRGE